MMDFRQRLEQTRLKSPESEIPDEAEPYFSCPYFATDKSKSSVCLELRLHQGKRMALPYSYVTELGFDVELGIELKTSGKVIRIKGRNLARLFDYLVAFRVRFIQVNTGNNIEEEGIFVEDIVIEGF